MLIPIGSDIRTQRRPIGNYVLIGLNVFIFLLTDLLGDALGPGLGTRIKAFYALDAARPSLYQYLTYQFLHGDILHLAGNMLFLWIFGNAVCDRMSSLGYTLFYLAGGVFAGFAFTLTADNPMVGASGSIAAVTTAYLALFPRVHITLLVWFAFVFTFQVPAMILIVFKIILWDNIIAPRMDAAAYANVAYSAHLGGYAFGFSIAMMMLLARALPRHQFDMLALWSRAGRRHGLAAGGLPPVARPVRVEEIESHPLQPPEPTPVERLRADVVERLLARDPHAAAATYLELLRHDPGHVLPAPQQIEVANHLAQTRRYAEAADAYEAFLNAYPAAGDTPEVRLFLGLICSRYLEQFGRAAQHLRKALNGLHLDAQRTLAEEELRRAEARLDTPPATG